MCANGPLKSPLRRRLYTSTRRRAGNPSDCIDQPTSLATYPLAKTRALATLAPIIPDRRHTGSEACGDRREACHRIAVKLSVYTSVSRRRELVDCELSACVCRGKDLSSALVYVCMCTCGINAYQCAFACARFARCDFLLLFARKPP